MLSLRSRLISRHRRARPGRGGSTLPPSGSGRPVLLLPPDAQVDDQVQPLVPERELALVDDQAGVELARPPRPSMIWSNGTTS